MHDAQYLKVEHRVLNEAPIPANLLIADLSLAHIALILDFDEVDLHNKSTYFNHIPNYLIRWYRFQKLNPVSI